MVSSAHGSEAETGHFPFVPVMHQSWRDLLFAHWPVEPDRVAAALPRELEVDTFDGTAYVGLVPFRVEGLRPPLLPPPPFVSSFGEVNVRTYVRYRGEPGVWFFSLDASSRLAVAGARLLYHLPYFTAAAQLERIASRVRFESERSRGGRCIAVWRTGPGDARPAPPGSLAEFLVERYVLFAAANGALYRARVAHEPYPLCPVELVALEQDLVGAAGFAVAGDPIVHASPGVDPVVSAPERLET